MLLEEMNVSACAVPSSSDSRGMIENIRHVVGGKSSRCCDRLSQSRTFFSALVEARRFNPSSSTQKATFLIDISSLRSWSIRSELVDIGTSGIETIRAGASGACSTQERRRKLSCAQDLLFQSDIETRKDAVKVTFWEKKTKGHISAGSGRAGKNQVLVLTRWGKATGFLRRTPSAETKHYADRVGLVMPGPHTHIPADHPSFTICSPTGRKKKTHTGQAVRADEWMNMH